MAVRDVKVRLGELEQGALAAVRRAAQELSARAVSDAEVLRECLLEQARRVGWEPEGSVDHGE